MSGRFFFFKGHQVAMQNQGFTLIELIMVTAIVGILATILIPNLFSGRSKAHDAVATSAARNILNALTAVDTTGDAVAPEISCPWASNFSTVTLNNETVSVSAPAPITMTDCSSTSASQYSVKVSYSGGNMPFITMTTPK